MWRLLTALLVFASGSVFAAGNPNYYDPLPLTASAITSGSIGANAGGATTNVQYNNNGAFGGDAGLTYISSTGTITPNLYGVNTSITASNTQVMYVSGTRLDGAQGMAYDNVSNRVTVGTPTGAAVTFGNTLRVSGTQTTTGLFTATGISNTANESVAGNLDVTGTLKVTGASTLTGLITSSGGISITAGNFTVTNTTAASVISGPLTLIGNGASATLNLSRDTIGVVGWKVGNPFNMIGFVSATNIVQCSTSGCLVSSTNATLTPSVTLHVPAGGTTWLAGNVSITTGYVHLGSPTTIPTCDATNKGNTFMNTTTNCLNYCDGTANRQVTSVAASCT